MFDGGVDGSLRGCVIEVEYSWKFVLGTSCDTKGISSLVYACLSITGSSGMQL